MYDIKYLNSNIISEEEVNGQKTIKIIMDISCYNFVVNTNTKQVTRGNGAKVNYYTLVLSKKKMISQRQSYKTLFFLKKILN